MRVLAISGSLRSGSYNTALVEALALLAPANMELVVFKGLSQLPLFNPDLDAHQMPAVKLLKQTLAASDGLIIASPEYAHGVSGVMKNALDWLVDGEEFINLPVALLNASPRAVHAQSALREVVVTMSGRVVDDASIAVPLLGSGLNARGIASDDVLAKDLRGALEAFRQAIEDFVPS